jgi:hypothetical protein
MSLRPIDAATLLPRISDAGRIQAQPQNQTALSLHVASLSGAQKAVRDAQQVTPKSEADRTGAYGDGQGNKGGQERRRSGKPKEQPEVKSKGPSGSGHRLDVKL